MSQLNTDAGFETFLIPLMAVGAGLLTFALFCEWVGVSAVGVFASIYKAGFGSWYSWNAAPANGTNARSIMRNRMIFIAYLCRLVYESISVVCLRRI